MQQAHQPLPGIEPQHFSRWLYLFLDTVESRYEPAAAVRFMEPALRIAQSLQLSRFGWDYTIPAEQQALLERVAPRRHNRDDNAHESARPRGEPFPTKIIGRGPIRSTARPASRLPALLATWKRHQRIGSCGAGTQPTIPFGRIGS